MASALETAFGFLAAFSMFTLPLVDLPNDTEINQRKAMLSPRWVMSSFADQWLDIDSQKSQKTADLRDPLMDNRQRIGKEITGIWTFWKLPRGRGQEVRERVLGLGHES